MKEFKVNISLNNQMVGFDHVAELGCELLTVSMKGYHLGQLSKLPEMFEDEILFQVTITDTASEPLFPPQSIKAKLVDFLDTGDGSYHAHMKFISGHYALAQLLLNNDLCLA